MANTITNTLNFSILSTEDSTNNVPIQRSVSPKIDLAFAQFTTYASLAAGNNAIAFPPGITTAYCVYVRNLHATNAIAVKFTPTGWALVEFANLGPGDCCLYWCTAVSAVAAENTTGNGITALTLYASAGTTTCEYFIGG